MSVTSPSQINRKMNICQRGNLLAHTAWPLEDTKINTKQHTMQHTAPPSTQHTPHGLWISSIFVVVCISCLGLLHFMTGRFKDAWWIAVLGFEACCLVVVLGCQCEWCGVCCVASLVGLSTHHGMPWHVHPLCCNTACS